MGLNIRFKIKLLYIPLKFYKFLVTHNATLCDLNYASDIEYYPEAH